MTAIERRFVTPEVRRGVSQRFIGYLALDALVGNTDRHHENWGIIQEPKQTKDAETGDLSTILRTSLAPTFDHGSSLGREMLDERRERILQDPNSMSRYIRKATGGIYRESTDKKGLSPLALIELVAERHPVIFHSWQKRIHKLGENYADSLVAVIPEACMSQTSKQFVLAFLMESRNLILSIK